MQRLVVVLVTVEMHSGLHTFIQMCKVKILTQVNVLSFQATPKPLDEYIVNPPAFAVHADAQLGTLEASRPIITRKL